MKQEDAKAISAVHHASEKPSFKKYRNFMNLFSQIDFISPIQK